MAQLAPRGTTITLDAIYRDGVGTLVNPTNPRLEILDPSNASVASNLVPVNDGVGLFHYDWAVAALAEMGLWTARWTGTIAGSAVSGDDFFEVIAAGDIGFTENIGANLGPCDPWPVADPWCCITGAAGSMAITGAPFIAITGSAAQAATEVLWAASGRQFGTCLSTVRPCRRECYGGSDDWITPTLMSGKWYNITCGSCGSGCACTAVEIVNLPTPVADIISVIIDGVTLPTSAYRVDNYRQLIRQDGGMWPLCQDLSLPNGDVGTWSVTLRTGAAVPHLGQMAMGELTCEFVKACTDGGDCRLPRHVAEQVRLGVTQRMPDVIELMKDGLIGLEMSDHFIRTYNPNGLKQRPRVFSPDAEPPTVTTWP